MDHGIFITFGSQVVQLPVNPDELKTIMDADNSTTQIVEFGEINRLGIAKLKGVTFESHFPTNPNEGYIRTRGDFRPPEFYENLINDIIASRRPCRLVVTNTRINMLASIESFDITHKHADGDVFYFIKLLEYREHAAKEVVIAQDDTAQTEEPRPPSDNQQLTVGAKVIVNGRLHRDSFGTGPGQTEVNATRRISHIVSGQGRVHVIHVKTLDGGHRGWVRESEVRLV